MAPPANRRLDAAKRLLANPDIPEYRKLEILKANPELKSAPENTVAPEPDEPPGLWESGFRGFAQGATSGLSDEISGLGAKAFDLFHGTDTPRSAVRGSMTDTSGPSSYEVERKAQDDRNKAAQEAHAGMYLGGGLLGAGAQGLALGAAGRAIGGTQALQPLRSLTAGLGPLTPVTQAAIPGLAMGAAYGAGTSDPGHRLEGSGLPSLVSDAKSAIGGDVNRLTSNPALSGMVTAGTLPLVVRGAGVDKMLAKPLHKAADVQRVKAYQHEVATAEARNNAPFISAAEERGINAANADDVSKAAYDNFKPNFEAADKAGVRIDTSRAAAEVKAELADLPDIPSNRQQRSLLTKLYKDFGGADDAAEAAAAPEAARATTIVPPSSRMAENLGALRAIEKAPTQVIKRGVQSSGRKSIDMRPDAAERVEFLPDAEYVGLEKAKTIRPGKARAQRAAPAPASAEQAAEAAAPKGLTLKQAVALKRLYDQKAGYTGSGQKRALSNQAYDRAGALIREEIGAALAGHPELAKNYADFNRTVSLAKTVKSIGKSFTRPDPVMQHAAGLAGAGALALHNPLIAAPLLGVEAAGMMGMPINAGAAGALRGAANALQGGLSPLQPGLGVATGGMAPQINRLEEEQR